MHRNEQSLNKELAKIRKERDQLKSKFQNREVIEREAQSQVSKLNVIKETKPFVDLEELEKLQTQLQRVEKDNQALVKDKERDAENF